MELPAISVVIPMYNAEKYVGELLNSILAQTFQNFEVIVVDDCSTDNSVAVVRNFMPLFGGRLTLTKTQKNCGGPGEPSNIGIAFSRGEYLLILDNDDTITPTALGELYSVAKHFDVYNKGQLIYVYPEPDNRASIQWVSYLDSVLKNK